MKTQRAVCALMLALFLVGCGSHRYVVVTEDYAVYTATTKPVIDPAENVVTFENENGDEVILPRDSIKKMQELSD